MLLIHQIINKVRGFAGACIPQSSVRLNKSFANLGFARRVTSFLQYRLCNQQQTNKITYLIIFFSISINLIGCDILNSSKLWLGKSPIPINKIAKTSENNENNTIYITGEVIKVAPLLGNNAYQVQDDTGSIWVISTGNLPSVGQNIFIKSKIRTQSLSLINQELDELYLVELEQVENP